MHHGDLVGVQISTQNHLGEDIEGFILDVEFIDDPVCKCDEDGYYIEEEIDDRFEFGVIGITVIANHGNESGAPLRPYAIPILRTHVAQTVDQKEKRPCSFILDPDDIVEAICLKETVVADTYGLWLCVTFYRPDQDESIVKAVCLNTPVFDY